MLNGWCVLIVAGLLVMQQIDMTAAYTMEETCKYIPDGFIADPNDCQSYGYCEDLKLKGKQKCPSGSYYNPNNGVCQYQKACRFNVGTMCQGIADLTVYPHPDNCTEYIYCENGVDFVGACPPNQIFDPTINECVYPGSSTGECAAKSICRLVQDNVFASDPRKCGNYVACRQGTGSSKPCPFLNGAQLYFSQKENKCQSTKFCVDNDNGNTNGGNQPPPTPDASKCTAVNQFLSDEATCYGYFKCTGVGEVGDWLQCPPQTHFNPEVQKCVTPYTYPCLKDRCGNMNEPFMASAKSNDCKNYLNCKNNAYIYTSTDPTFMGVACNKGYFFDEFMQQCVPNNPASNTNYILCPNPPPPINGQ